MLAGVPEVYVRAGVFLALAAALLALERLAPRKRRMGLTRQRWLTNGLLVGLNTVLMRGIGVLAPLASAGVAAAWAEHEGVGLLNVLTLPLWARCVVALLALDFAIWLQHVAFHRIGWLWRVHRVHHADRDVDVTTALRFHPVEIALSAAFKSCLAIMLGAPPAAVLVFEIALNAGAMFNHANLALPRWLDAALRLVIVTPDMHRVHHSIRREEHDSNFGFWLSIWDRLLGSYRAHPLGGHADMTIGLKEHQTDAPSRLWWSLALPFRKSAGA